MRVEVNCRPACAVAVVRLDAGDEICAERGALVAMSSRVQPTVALFGSYGGGAVELLTALFSSLMRMLMGGESGVINVFKAADDDQVVMLAPTLPGDIAQTSISPGEVLHIDGSSWLASTRGVRVTVAMAGTGAALGGQEFFVVRCEGEGDVLFHSYGGMERIDVDGRYIVDGGHAVAWQGDLAWRPRAAARSLKSALLSGEGLVVEFRGRGQVWVQTRALAGGSPTVLGLES